MMATRFVLCQHDEVDFVSSMTIREYRRGHQEKLATYNTQDEEK
jgi:hypothetical protein